MRTLFVVWLALVLVALPAAQAAACACDVERSETSCGCCCADAGRACSCCPNGDEEEPSSLVDDCSCTHTAPQAPAPAADELPAGGEPVAPPTADAPAGTGRAHVVAPVERHSPHPAVSLPLLL